MAKIRLGIIGAGGIARRRVLPALSDCDRIDVVAVMDPHTAAEVAKEFQISKFFTNEDELLKDASIDAVYIASPVFEHERQLVACAMANKHVLCEKPLTMTLQQTESVISLFHQRKLFLQEGYMMKFHGAHQWISKTIREGKIGKVVSLRAQLSCWYPPMKGAWRQVKSKGGGGCLVDMSTHLYDLLLDFAGPIQGISARVHHQVHDYEVEDSAVTLLDFKSGAIGTVESFFCVPDHAVPTRLEIYGTQGAILSEGTIGQGGSGSLKAILNDGQERYESQQNKGSIKSGFEDVSYQEVNPYRAEFELFAECILQNRPLPTNNSKNAWRISHLVNAAYRSSDEQRRIEVPSEEVYLKLMN